MKKLTLLILILILPNFLIFANEGMWIPLLLKKYNIADMQKKGFKLTADDIYSINHSSLKDAVVIFGRGCTGEVISDQGLVLTNHHCGYSSIQSHSSVEHDYLTDGFWAYDKSQELTNQGLTVTFLERIEDVSASVLKNITDETSEVDRNKIIDENIAKLKKENDNNGKFKIEIKPFYYGNEYYMFVYKVYTDVRLVGAPPSAIGKFGGDTDNWMWPRHTGDFSIFRIYADKNNNPAKYSKDNVPYKPKKSLEISLNGIKKGDFTMVMGYPGRTSEYLTSNAVKFISQVENPQQIYLRKKRLDIMKKYMDKSTKVRIQYSAKYARVSNYWKKWIGEDNGLKRLNAIAKKQNLERKINNWMEFDQEKQKKYGPILSQYRELYKNYEPIKLAKDYIFESALAIELVKFSRNLELLNNFENLNDSTKKALINKLKKSGDSFYKNFYLPIDKEVFETVLPIYKENLNSKFHPKFFETITKKYKGDFTKYANDIYKKSFLTSQEKYNNFLDHFSNKKLQKEPFYLIYKDFKNIYSINIYSQVNDYHNKFAVLNRKYIKLLQDFKKDKIFFPDANFTMRVAYGNVDGYFPKDGVEYKYYTTLSGIIEKDNPDIYDYKVPEKLKELYKNKDYGNYAQNDTMHVCFIATNHTTGGNSGSPVLNAYGQLIGVNFDRNWEGTMSDIMYDPDQCRNIVLDIRYVLFIVDKFAGAKNLIKELNIKSDS